MSIFIFICVFKGLVTQAKRKKYVWIAYNSRLFARVLRDFEGLCVVERDVQSEHESRTDRVRTALISLGTR